MTSQIQSRHFEKVVLTALAALCSTLIGTLLHLGFTVQVVA